jgi:hypothetical protein
VDLRLRSLEHLDTRAVPLPHGTEVVTRVDRIVGERRVPQGSIGRVAKADGEELDVTIVGIGVVRYARDELSPRRAGSWTQGLVRISNSSIARRSRLGT